MRTGLPTLLLLACLAAPLQAQTCRKVPPPPLPSLFPESVLGMELQFASDPTGGCTAMYRPSAPAERQSRPWVMASAVMNEMEGVGETAESVSAYFKRTGFASFTLDGWPVVMRDAPLGEEFVLLRGSVKVVVLIKNGDKGEVSSELAASLLEKILPQIPCG